MRAGIYSAVVGFMWLTGAKGEEWTKVWQVQARPELRVTAGDASVSVEVGSDREISALVRTRGIGIGSSGVRITERQEGNRVEVEIREPSMHWSWGMRSIEVHLKVPRELTADVHTGDGSIHLSGLHGALRVDTGDGSIQGDDLEGQLDARSGDGSLHVRGRFDDVKVRTSDGSVEVQALPGSKLNSGWRVETGDGSVHLAIPRDLAADVQLRTGDGSIHSDLPLTVQGTRREHELEGKLNGGGPFLEVRTGDGSITLSGL
ncbi:MAG TPA: DUF4097 family beta strand repeat-containing protein [Bryobacteraceae bacterium]|jgi:hypothetical protein|nr:DUF4097 family beta strand repeat-containing protein [Bryobacteraceae bacterium]